VSVIRRAVVSLGVLACLALPGCGQSSLPDEPVDAAQVDPIKGTDLNRITLSAGSAEHIGIRTAPVRTAPGKLEAIPYSAVMYDSEGKPYTYESPKRLTFVRHEIAIDHLTATVAYLRDGPALGRAVVTVGAPELLGTEEGVEED
jgi:hypothetical protein